jgi:peroxin-13
MSSAVGSSALPTSQPTISTVTSSSTTSGPPPIPQRPSSLTDAVNRNASAYSPYGANRIGALGASTYGGIGSAYSSPYSRLGGMGAYGGYGSGMYGGMGGYGGYGSGMYGGMGMGGMYGGMGTPGNPNDPASLTQAFSQSTQATFQIIESIVGAFGGFAQMLESTYLATHSSFFGKPSTHL